MGKTKPGKTPPNWPSSVRYLTSPIYTDLTPAQLTAIRTRSAEQVHACPGSANVRIAPITDPQHPACGQSGLFAARDLRPGELVVTYLGETHRGSRSSSSSDYDLWLDRDADVAVDAARAGNEARFINDYRGVPGLARRRPNAEFRVVWDARRGEKLMAVFVLAAGKRAAGKEGWIGKGQEILVSYGKGFWQERGKAE